MRSLKVNKLAVLSTFFICGAIFYMKTENKLFIDKLSERFMAVAHRILSDIVKGSDSSNCDISKKTVNWGMKKTIDDYHSASKGNDRIFFHETSGRINLSFRQTCAIESAALHNMRRPIQVFIQPQEKSYLHSSLTWLRVLDHYPNTMAIAIDDEELYFRDSPLEEWYRKGEWRYSPFRVEHVSDYIRILSLYKEGGMFLDMDIVTTKPYDGILFRNCTLIESGTNDQLTNAIIHLDRGHRLTVAILNLLNADYDPAEYTFHGPQVVSLAVSQVCNMSFSHKSRLCPNIRMLPHRFFYPIGNAFWTQFFEDSQSALGKNILKRIDVGYGFHMWNNLSNKKAIDISDNSTQVLAVLASKHCPITWDLRHQFTIN